MFESCRFPSFIFLPFFLSFFFFFFSAPVASKGVDDDLSAYIPGKNIKGYERFCYETRLQSQTYSLLIAHYLTNPSTCDFILGGGGMSSLSMHATAGSDLADDFDNLSQDPMQPGATSERVFASSNTETFLPSR